ncbi:hypothetical protein O181_080282 [Austropuccinia psidii MF-1]|uniref:Uncharacterized protein n=1 Tax=Austropuccinia psidii MF-1 TaxID=1389203 RepID=A0A9Q3IHA8_9BASI|nr:hypothetical protein [Austropuccinia psidii MF-1]
MPVQHSPPARQTRSQARTEAVLTQTPRVPLDGTPAAPQLRAQLDRGPHLEGAAPSRKEGRGPRRPNPFSVVVGGFPGPLRTTFKGPGEEEQENPVEEEDSDGTEGVPYPVGASQGTGGPPLSQSNQPVSHQSEPSLLAIIQQMTQNMANFQAALSSEESRPPAFKTPSLKEPQCFDGTQPFKVRSFIQSSQLCILDTCVKKSLKLFVFSSLSDVFYSILIDSGATNSFIAKMFVHKYSLTMSELLEKIPLIIMDSSDSPSLYVTHHTKYIDYHYPSNSFSNAFSSEKSCEALVGYSRTPSFLSSFHIPSLNSHQSLLSSRDEVFKEIQDFGEDNSVSSLILFLGNRYLPPSSYHDSLEGLLDEEEEPEEIEMVMKVVPSAYHQYLDVLSKVKAEKLPPNGACDHHIELEGSLPPVGDIYPL